MTNREGVNFHNDYIPPPRRTRWSALGESGQHGGVDPNFPAYSRRTPTPPDPVYAFTQVTDLRPQALRIAKRRRFATPTRYMRRASEPRFRSSEALSRTWWQVKDSNLRSFRDGFTVPRLQACDQRKRLTCNNFRAYSPQTAVASRGQPDAKHALPDLPSWVPPNKNYGDGMPAAPTLSTSWSSGSPFANYETSAKPSPRFLPADEDSPDPPAPCVYLATQAGSGSDAAADQFSISPAAVRQQCSRARRQLTTAVQDELARTADTAVMAKTA
jgi:hypothetical protein